MMEKRVTRSQIPTIGSVHTSPWYYVVSSWERPDKEKIDLPDLTHPV